MRRMSDTQMLAHYQAVTKGTGKRTKQPIARPTDAVAMLVYTIMTLNLDHPLPYVAIEISRYAQVANVGIRPDLVRPDGCFMRVIAENAPDHLFYVPGSLADSNPIDKAFTKISLNGDSTKVPALLRVHYWQCKIIPSVEEQLPERHKL